MASVKYKKIENQITNKYQFSAVTLYIIIIAVFVFLYTGLINLQVVEGSKNYIIASRTNQSSVKLVAPRGVIYDSNGNKLAYNIASYSLYVKTNELNTADEERFFSAIGKRLGEDGSLLQAAYKLKAYDEQGNKEDSQRITIKSDLSYEQYFALLANNDQLKGLYINVEPLRYYETGIKMANILGYVGDPDQNDIKKGIFSESQVGKVGLERYYDSYLRGKEGVQVKERDPITKEYKVYDVQEVQAGNNLYLTIDQQWQAALYKALSARSDEVKAFAGAGIIINSDTGEVKAMVSYPSYDDNLFARGISSKDYLDLINNPKRPLINRPVALQLPPGSTWKLIGATAALESGVVNENTNFYSNRFMDLPGGVRLYEADGNFLGNLNFKKALGYSSNLYFCNAAIEMNKLKNGPEYLLGFASQYGLGKKTGVDLYEEQAGSLPSRELKKILYREPWYIGDDCNTIIGQGMDAVTPIQMAVVASAINNGGKVLKPYLVSKISNQNDEVVQRFSTEVVTNIQASQSTFDIIKNGMRFVVESGTGNALKDSPGNVIAKTGSSDAAEIIDGKRYSGAHSWTVGCFEYQSQHYCFATMLQWGGRGYKSSPIMKNFINCLYSDFKGQCTN
jgi:penicillin-binding protein 2